MTALHDTEWESRAAAVTAGVYAASQGHEAERRERVKAVLTCLILDSAPADLIGMLGVPADEIAIARTIADRLGAAPPEPRPDPTRPCPRCHVEQPLGAYIRAPGRAAQLSPWCRPCHLETLCPPPR